MVRFCTMAEETTATLPYLDFYDIPKKKFNSRSDGSTRLGGFGPDGQYLYDIAPYAEFLYLDNAQSIIGQVLPSAATFTCIQQTLRSKRLSGELIQHVLQLTGYVDPGSSRRPYKIRHHLFHPENRLALLGHIEFCWRLLVHCGMFWDATVNRPMYSDWSEENGPEPVHEPAFHWELEVKAAIDYGL